VRPDGVLAYGSPNALIIDAKYKTNLVRGAPEISTGDLYEALAFAQATGINEVLLAYPAPVVDSEMIKPGTIRVFEEVKISNIRVRAATLVASGIGRRGGLRSFAAGLHAFVTSSPEVSAATDAGGAPQLVHAPPAG
jgi:hypothetical protein